MKRLYQYPERSVYHGWWQGWAPAVFIFLLACGLIYTAGLVYLATETAANLRGQLARDAQLIEDGDQDRAMLRAEVDRLTEMTPTERIVVPPCIPQRRDQKLVTPVFSRDSQFSGVTR